MSTSPDILFLARPIHPGSGSTRPPSRALSFALEGEAVPSRAPVRPAAYAAHRRFALPGALLLIAASASAAPAEVPWRGYAVYQPTIERAIVVDACAQPLRYNHDSSVAWFGDRWFCVWNANVIPVEGAPGQLNYVSTSHDGLNWSAPRPVFSDPSLSVNPIPCPKGTQWQPNLLVVGTRLWCIWSQNSKDAHNGCYFSTLDSPEGVWTNRLLTWNGQADPAIDGHPHRLFPTQNPVRLSTGRVLSPVTTIGPVSANPAAGENAWYGREKRNSVIYTDDEGLTWRVSSGAMLPGLDWRQWEPTVWEQPDGSVMMFARNNLIPAFEKHAAKPEEALTWAVSRDGGATWTPHAFVPLETVVSRMHVMRQPSSVRNLMIHNDWPAGTFGADRRNLALFVNRGGGFDFTAGTGLTGREPEVAYPQMDFHGNALLFSYSQGPCALRSIRAVRVSPLPDPDRLYLYPRENLPLAPQCALTNGTLLLSGGLALKCRAAPAVLPTLFRAEAWVNPDDDGVLFDNRGTACGFVWGLSGSSFVHLGEPAKNIRSTLPVPRGRWSRVGLALDYAKGEVRFSVNEQTERVSFKPGKRTLSGASATLFGPNSTNSSLTAFEGAVRSLTLDGTNRLFNAAAPARFAADFLVSKGGAGSPSPLLTSSGGTSVSLSDDRCLLRLTGAASAGVELDGNEREAGDAVELEFSFLIEGGVTGTLCTVGDALRPAHVTFRGTEIALVTAAASRRCGPITPGAWQRLSLHTQRGLTRVTIDANRPVEVLHAPQATWLYLGEGYRTALPAEDASFRIDVSSVRSRVILSPQMNHQGN